MTTLLKALSGVLAVAIVVGTYVLTWRPTGLGFFGEQPLSAVVPGVVAALLMLLGILCGSLYRRLNGSTGGAIDILGEARAVVNTSSFWASICISPLIFAVAFAPIEENPAKLAGYLLAFQNGFFCQTVFNQLFQGTRSAAPVASG